MIQPAAPPAEAGPGPTLAVAALGLALIAIEARVRQEVEDTITALYKGLAAAGLLAAATAPGTLLTGLALISLPAWFTVTSRLSASARLKVRDSIRTAYKAAAEVSYTQTLDDLGPDNLPGRTPGPTDNLDRLLADIDTMFGHAQTDLANTIVTEYDPRDPAGLADIILDNATTLRNRAQATAGTAVHTGANDALNNLFNDYQNRTGIPGLMKRWVATAADPCGMCAALDGTLVGINAEFDYNATTVEKDYRRVWRNLAGPPRHPNCRCQLELVIT